MGRQRGTVLGVEGEDVDRGRQQPDDHKQRRPGLQQNRRRQQEGPALRETTPPRPGGCAKPCSAPSSPPPFKPTDQPRAVDTANLHSRSPARADDEGTPVRRDGRRDPGDPALARGNPCVIEPRQRHRSGRHAVAADGRLARIGRGLSRGRQHDHALPGGGLDTSLRAGLEGAKRATSKPDGLIFQPVIRRQRARVAKRRQADPIQPATRDRRRSADRPHRQAGRSRPPAARPAGGRQPALRPEGSTGRSCRFAPGVYQPDRRAQGQPVVGDVSDG